MAFSVPLLLEVVEAVVYRLDQVATRGVDPPGPVPAGYDDFFREPVVYDLEDGASVATRISSRRELPPVRVRCQVETPQYNAIKMSFAGNVPQTQMTLVVYKPDMRLLGLVDDNTGNLLIAPGDRVTQLERPGLGVLVSTFPDDGLYVVEVTPASWGFGADGQDLYLIALSPRDKSTT